MLILTDGFPPRRDRETMERALGGETACPFLDGAQQSMCIRRGCICSSCPCWEGEGRRGRRFEARRVENRRHEKPEGSPEGEPFFARAFQDGTGEEEKPAGIIFRTHHSAGTDSCLQLSSNIQFHFIQRDKISPCRKCFLASVLHFFLPRVRMSEQRRQGDGDGGLGRESDSARKRPGA